jgi:hypothetical protein
MHGESGERQAKISHGRLPASYNRSIIEAYEATITACEHESLAGKFKNAKISPNACFFVIQRFFGT